MNSLGIEEIKQIIPHRHPFLLVDAIEDYEPGEYAVGYKCVTLPGRLFRRPLSRGAGNARRSSSSRPWPRWER